MAKNTAGQQTRCTECGDIHPTYNNGVYTCSSCGAQFTPEDLLVAASFNDPDDSEPPNGNWVLD